MKEKITNIITVCSLCAVLVSYGIWIGTISNRLDNVEQKTNKIENTLEQKIDTLNKSINDLTITVAVLSEKVEQLNKK